MDFPAVHPCAVQCTKKAEESGKGISPAGTPGIFLSANRESRRVRNQNIKINRTSWICPWHWGLGEKAIQHIPEGFNQSFTKHSLMFGDCILLQPSKVLLNIVCSFSTHTFCPKLLEGLKHFWHAWFPTLGRLCSKRMRVKTLIILHCCSTHWRPGQGKNVFDACIPVFTIQVARRPWSGARFPGTFREVLGIWGKEQWGDKSHPPAFEILLYGTCWKKSENEAWELNISSCF